MAKDAKIKADKNTEEVSSTTISKSKAKRDERRKEIAREKHRKLTVKIAGIAIVAVIAVLIAAAAGESIYLAAIRTNASPDFSQGLTPDGRIADFDVRSAVTLADYAHLTPEQEITVTVEEVDNKINNTLTSHQTLSTDPSLQAADGDKLNIDFVGTVDGEEFEGGNSKGAGYDVTIGSGSMIDDFEQQLIDHKPGDQFTVEVTFPENYGQEALNGKDASFAVTINGIYTVPDLTDAFVAENFADEGISTVEEYRAMVEKEFYNNYLKTYLNNYILENSVVNKYPSKYVKTIKALTKYNDEYTMQMYAMYGGGLQNLWDLRGENITNELSYEKELVTRAKDSVKSYMIYQAIFEQEGLSFDMEAVLAELTEINGADYVEEMKQAYGEAYMAQTQIKNAVLDFLMERYQKP